MADLGKNQLWSDISNGKDVSTDLLGPSYSYADHVPGPSSLGVGSDGSFSQLGQNAAAISTYIQTLISGDPPLGNQYFVNTGGTCTAPDGSTQPRYNYINNMSSGSADLPASISELGADFNGLIPGVLGDIEGLDPLYMFSAISSDASPQCACYKCNVTSGSQYQFLTPSLDPDFSSSQCSQVDTSLCTTTESFSNKTELSSLIPTLLVGTGLLYLIFSGK